MLTYRQKKRVSCLYRTATTKHPCCIPTLGDSMGAGRIRLTQLQKYNFFPIQQNLFPSSSIWFVQTIYYQQILNIETVPYHQMHPTFWVICSHEFHTKRPIINVSCTRPIRFTNHYSQFHQNRFPISEKLSIFANL